MFKTGDKVRLKTPCINLSMGKTYEVVKGETYAEYCEGIGICDAFSATDLDGIYLEIGEGRLMFFFSSRFELVVE